MKECMSASDRKDHYKKHNHRIHEDHTRKAAKGMDTRKMQLARHAQVTGSK